MLQIRRLPGPRPNRNRPNASQDYANSLFCKDYSEHPAQRFRCAPQQLVSYCKCRQVARAHRKFSQATDRDMHLPTNGSRSKFAHGRFSRIRYNSYPRIRLGNDALYVRERHIML